MYSIASLFDTDLTGPWQKLVELCEYSGITPHTIPHFSWQTAENYQLTKAESKLTAIAATIPTFKFTTSGFGVFTNNRKILFLIIVKTRLLLEIHEILWNELLPLTEEPKMYYSPENWIPHISINLESIRDEQINCSITELLKHDLQFEFEVKNLGLLFLIDRTAGIAKEFPLKG
ncbi:MAG: 2'-5' RNA ligase family protein [Anaerolineaceae bacterium]